MRDLSDIAKALGDENRLRILLALLGGELCACQLVELLQLAGSTVSKHLALLRLTGLIEARKQGRWIYYRLADSKSTQLVVQALKLISGALANDEQIRSDQKRLVAIVKLGPERLCRRR